jgi:hypothetical protein
VKGEGKAMNARLIHLVHGIVPADSISDRDVDVRGDASNVGSTAIPASWDANLGIGRRHPNA